MKFPQFHRKVLSGISGTFSKKNLKKYIWIPKLCLLGASFFAFGGLVGKAVSLLDNEALETTTQSTSWGLGFGEEGTQPTGNASPSELAQNNAYYLRETDEKIIYLTFDAGYESGQMPAILDALKKHNVSATFFVVANFIKDNPDLVKRMVKEGQIVANHTTTHPDMSAISTREAFQKELSGVEQIYEEVTGQSMIKFYRPPRGVFSQENLAMAKEMGYYTFFWSLAYVDWLQDDQPTKEEAFEKLLGRIHPGAIVLLHSTSATNGEILDELLDKWEEMGYSFGTLEDFVTTPSQT